MRIGVISDTHIPISCCDLPSELISALKGCDLIVHAGDLIDLYVLDELKKISKVEAVCGNMDLPKVQAALEKKRVIEVAGKTICVMHGYGNPDMLVSILKEEFLSQKPDIIIFGHSHIPMNEYIDNVLFFNPGSATDTTFAPYRSYGIIEIEDGEIKAAMHKLS